MNFHPQHSFLTLGGDTPVYFRVFFFADLVVLDVFLALADPDFLAVTLLAFRLRLPPKAASHPAAYF